MKAQFVFAFTALLITSGCGAEFDGAAYDASFNDDLGPDGQGGEAASMRLYAHDVVGAREAYADARRREPNSGQAAAGYAVTSLLLLPYSDAATTLFTAHLGAQNALDTHGDVLWGDDGLAYFLARGVAWEDSSSTAGMKTLLADRLPWSRAQLDTLDGFVTGLNNPVSMMGPSLVALAGELEGIAEVLLVPSKDADFGAYFLPGAVFHDDALDLNLGQSELSALRGVVSGAAAALQFFAAYDHAWTLERALGESVWAPTVEDPMDPDHVPGASIAEYQAAHVNASFGRAVDVVARLSDARDNARASLQAFADALEFGAAETNETALSWQTVDDAAALRFAEFLDALADALDTRTTLPYTEPAQSADFGPLFEGRVLTPEVDAFVVSEYDDGMGGFERVVEVNGDAITSFLDGVFDPDFDTEPAPQLTIEDEVSTLLDTVTSDVADDYERSVGGAF